MSDPEAPLLSADEPEEGEEAPEEAAAPAPTEAAVPAAPPRPPMPTFKFSTFLYVFCGLLGVWMLFDTSFRNSIADALGTSPTSNGPLYYLIGFGSNYLLATMLLAGAIEMLITALAYNFTTDWIKAAKVQKWSAAFRKVQMEAIRSGKKDRIAALRPYQERLTRLSSEVTIAQFKGMAITYFLLILIYTWVGVVIGAANSVQRTINLGGTIIDLSGTLFTLGSAHIPYWFFIFSLYTVPFSLVFRRLLKHVWLRRYVSEHHLGDIPPPPALTPAGRSA